MNHIDPFGLYSFDEFLSDAAQFSAGMGDNISFGFTNWVRDRIGGNDWVRDRIGGNDWVRDRIGASNDVVNKCSGTYKVGGYAGIGVGVGITAGLTAEVKGTQIGLNAIKNVSVVLSTRRLWSEEC